MTENKELWFSKIDNLDILMGIFICAVMFFSLYFIKQTPIKKIEDSEVTRFEEDPSLITGKFFLNPETPAMSMDHAGRGLQLFHEGTFGNEMFLTCVAGLDKLIPDIKKSILDLKGKGTGNTLASSYTACLACSRTV